VEPVGPRKIIKSRSRRQRLSQPSGATQCRDLFITNRDYKLETPTVENLFHVLDMDINKSQVLCQNERPDWTWNKTSRRAFVANCHRILLLLGDDFNDFTYQGKLSPQERVRQGMRFKTTGVENGSSCPIRFTATGKNPLSLRERAAHCGKASPEI